MQIRMPVEKKNLVIRRDLDPELCETFETSVTKGHRDQVANEKEKSVVAFAAMRLFMQLPLSERASLVAIERERQTQIKNQRFSPPKSQRIAAKTLRPKRGRGSVDEAQE